MASPSRHTPWLWIFTSVVVIAGVGVLIRLGIWQLERLEWRRAFNQRATAQMSLPALDLNVDNPGDRLVDMEYRAVVVTGVYDHADEVLLRNHVWQNRPGYRILTPLRIFGSDQAVIIDRGWIPLDGAADLSLYEAPGTIRVMGMIRRPQTRPDIGGVRDPTLAPGETRLAAFNIVNLDRLQQQVDQPLLPVYIQCAPDSVQTTLPYCSLPEIEITEGPHFGYALQWFAFAALLGIGYPVFAYRQIKGHHGMKFAEQEHARQAEGSEQK